MDVFYVAAMDRPVRMIKDRPDRRVRLDHRVHWADIPCVHQGGFRRERVMAAGADSQAPKAL